MGMWLDSIYKKLKKKRKKEKGFSVNYGIQRSNFYNSYSVGTDYI